MLAQVANDLRSQGHVFVVSLMKELLVQEQGSFVIESVRNLKEIQGLKELSPSFVLMAVDADVKLRYARAVERGSETDKVTFQEFQSQEEAEMQSTDPDKQNLSACIGAADVVFQNSGSLEDLEEKVKLYMGTLA